MVGVQCLTGVATRLSTNECIDCMQGSETTKEEGSKAEEVLQFDGGPVPEETPEKKVDEHQELQQKCQY